MGMSGRCHVAASGLAVWLVGAVPAHAADAACRPIIDAMTKLLQTPHHQFLTMRANEPPVETIYTGSVIYVRVRGAWSVSPVTIEQMRQSIQERLQTNTANCQYVRDEAVSGQAATVYSVHGTTPRGTTDSQVWLSKSSGLPLQQTIELPARGQNAAFHSTDRFDYTDVGVPAGVK